MSKSLLLVFSSPRITFYMLALPGSKLLLLRAVKPYLFPWALNYSSPVNDLAYSIVIPLLGYPSQAFVEGLLISSPLEDMEVILVGEQQKTLEEVSFKLGLLASSILIEPGGHALALSKGFSKARGKTIIAFDPAFCPTPGWIREIENVLSKDMDAIVLSAASDGRGRFLESGIVLALDASARHYGEGAASSNPDFRFKRETDASSIAVGFRKETLPIFERKNEELLSFAGAVSGLCLEAKAQGHKIILAPASLLSLPGSSTDWPATYEERRPNSLKVVASGRPRVLVLGIYLASAPNAAKDIVARISESTSLEVEQRWISLGGNALPGLEEVTVKSVNERVPKFSLLNDLLADSDLSDYDYVVITDDDIVCPRGFLDSLIGLQQKFAFDIAQPARTANSYTDHPIVEAHHGLAGRETWFVEIGPLFSIGKRAFSTIFPFDLRSPMGWGYEQVWAKKAQDNGFRMGIIDGCPIDHGLRKPVVNYSWHEAKAEQNFLLSNVEHLPLDECFSVLEVHLSEELR